MNHTRRLTCRAIIAIAAGWCLAPPAVDAQAAGGPATGDAIISGVVTAAVGAPLAGVTVAIVSLRIGTTTKDDGHYSFTVPASMPTGQTVLHHRPIDRLQGQTVDVRWYSAGAKTQNFTLESTPLQLGEIVVTGEGTTATARELATARGSVSDSAILKSNEPNITTALAAKAPGVQVTSTSGDPGASTQIVIRGINTLGGGERQTFGPAVHRGWRSDRQLVDHAVLSRSAGVGGRRGGVAEPRDRHQP